MGTELLERPCCLGSQNSFQNEWPERLSEGGRRSVKGTLGTVSLLALFLERMSCPLLSRPRVLCSYHR